jgi:cytochrome c oxidase cbb3-type subunit 3
MNMRTAQKSSSFVLASLKPSTYTKRTPRAIVRCGLAGRTFSPFSIVLLVMLGAVVVTAAQEDEPAAIEPASARKAATLLLARCAVCHTTDLIVQQRLPGDRWTTTVEKMVHWGADLSKDETGMLLQFLTARYHPGAPDQLPSIEEELAMMGHAGGQGEATDGPLTGVAARGAGLFAHNCQACHGEGAVGGAGPKLANNRILKNEGAFWETVLHGRGPMPAWGPVLSHQEIADIHAWLTMR